MAVGLRMYKYTPRVITTVYVKVGYELNIGIAPDSWRGLHTQELLTVVPAQNSNKERPLEYRALSPIYGRDTGGEP